MASPPLPPPPPPPLPASASASASRADYDAFLEKVKRTVFIDSLSPQVTEPVLRTALDQFGKVTSIVFIPSYTVNISRCGLVEMENEQQAKNVVVEITQLPFMISGMPRPVRARRAELEMFDNRPAKPGRNIDCKWLDRDDPQFVVAQKKKRLVAKHAAETTFLLKKQLEEEEKLHTKQGNSLKADYRKYEMIDALTADNTAQRLADRYNIRKESLY